MSRNAVATSVRRKHGDELRHRTNALLAALARKDEPSRLRAEAHALRGAAVACGVAGAAPALDALDDALSGGTYDSAGATRTVRLLLLEIDQVLATDVLHDVRSAVNVVLGYARLLEASEEDAGRRGWAASIASAAERIADMADRLDPTSNHASPGPSSHPAAPVASPRPTVGRAGPFAILIVEDDPATTDFVLAALAGEEEVHVIAASSVEDAVRLAGAETPDLVLLDNRLPDGDALAALHRLGGGHSVIVLTADGSVALHEELRTAGATAVLTKPISPAEIVAAVSAVRWSRPDRGTDPLPA